MCSSLLTLAIMSAQVQLWQHAGHYEYLQGVIIMVKNGEKWSPSCLCSGKVGTTHLFSTTVRWRCVHVAIVISVVVFKLGQHYPVQIHSFHWQVHSVQSVLHPSVLMKVSKMRHSERVRPRMCTPWQDSQTPWYLRNVMVVMQTAEHNLFLLFLRPRPSILKKYVSDKGIPVYF